MESRVVRGRSGSCRPGILSASALLAAVSWMLYSLTACTITSSGSLHIHSFSNAALNGKYTYTISGLSLPSAGNNPYQESGVFVADGKGNLTGGVDDLVQGGATTTSQVTGSYTIAGDGTGQMTLMGAQQIQLALTMVSGSKLYLVEYDGLGNGSGAAVLQSSNLSTPSGTYVVHTHSSNYNSGFAVSNSMVGTLTLSNTSINGSADLLQAGSLQSITMSGTFAAPDDNGRGTATLTDSNGTTTAYFYYLIDSATLNLLETDTVNFGGGHAEAQTGTPFTTANLNGSFSFRSQGDTLTHNGGINSIGAFSTDGNGNITGGTYDSTADGVPILKAPLTGTYNLASNGRATINIAPQNAASVDQIAWMVSPGRYFFLVNANDRVEDGTADQQTNQPFDTSSVKGQYAFFMYGYNQNAQVRLDRVGTIVFDNSQTTVAFSNYYLNRSGALSQVGAQGVTYTTDGNGRMFSSPSGVSEALVIYLTSPTGAYLILGDDGLEISGRVEQQVVP